MSDSELKKIAENAKAIIWWRRFFQKIISTFFKILISTKISTHGLSSFQKKRNIKNKTAFSLVKSLFQF